MRWNIKECHRVHSRPQRFNTFIAREDPDAPTPMIADADGAVPPAPLPAPQFPWAHSVFTPEELAARLGAYAARAALCLPLFTDGPAEPEPVTLSTGKRPGQPVARYSECYVCGQRAPAQASRGLGWQSRALAGGQGETESYCPECFDVFGWGDTDDE